MVPNSVLCSEVVPFSEVLYRMFHCVSYTADEMFPTVKLNVLGCGLVLEPTLLEFLKHLPLQAWNAPAQNTPPSGSGGGGGGAVGVSSSLVMTRDSGVPASPTPLLPYTLTPTLSVTDQSDDDEGGDGEEKDRLLSTIKCYAIKVSYCSFDSFHLVKEKVAIMAIMAMLTKNVRMYIKGLHYAYIHLAENVDFGQTKGKINPCFISSNTKSANTSY